MGRDRINPTVFTVNNMTTVWNGKNMTSTETKPCSIHLMAFAKLIVNTCLFSLPHFAIASNACPPLPCTSAAECRAIASWAIEGTVLDAIGDKPGEACIPGPLLSCKNNSTGGMVCAPENYCGWTAPQPILVLEKVSVLKSSFSYLSKNLRALVQRSSMCYTHQISSPLPSSPGVDLTLIERVPPIGERLRVYGLKEDRVGYYYFVEFADPALLGCAANSPPFQCIPAR